MQAVSSLPVVVPSDAVRCFASPQRLTCRLSLVLEFAGEIKDAFPRKKVTIVHSDSQLLNSTYPNKYRKQVEKGLASRGVNVVFNDYVDNFDTIPATTRSQRQLEGDLIVRSF